MRTTGTRLLLTVALSLLLSVAGGSLAQEPLDPEPVEVVDEGPELSGAELSATVSLLLPYQGRLTSPGTGQPVPDADYSMTFTLYNADAGGSALWTETKTVSVVGGLFATNLGDGTLLSQSTFSGQALWLGIKVGADSEAAPRVPILPVAYALSVVPGASLSGSTSAPSLSVANTSTSGSGAMGVYATTSSTTNGVSAVRGRAGTSGNSPGNIVGVLGESSTGYGVFGTSSSSIGVYGYSGGYGVYGAGMGAQPGVFGGNWGTGYGAQFYKPGGTAVYAQGSVTVTENLKVNGKVSGAYTSLPVAYGHIASTGSKYSGSSNVSSTWDATYTRYSITISGETYSYRDYITVVSADGSCPNVGTVDSVSGKLLVRFGGSQCSFQFVTYKP